MIQYITLDEFSTLPSIILNGQLLKVKIEPTVNDMYPFAVQSYRISTDDPNMAISGQYLEMCKNKTECKRWIAEHLP